jgi:hypothetical protein
MRLHQQDICDDVVRVAVPGKSSPFRSTLNS